MRKIILPLQMLVLGVLAHSIAAQNVGINTSNPSAALDIQSTGNTATTMAVSISNSNNDTLWVLRDNGNVGIGTTQPTAPLEVQTQNAIAARFSAPIEGQPAVNVNELVTLGQLQAVSAAGSSSGSAASNASMWSTSFTTSNAYFGNAVIFCRTLTDGGFSDWRVPTVLDVIKLMEDSSIPLPVYAAGASYWLTLAQAVNGNGAFPLIYIGNSNLTTNNSFYFLSDWTNNGSARAFCVR